MSLILTLLTREKTIQVSDRRLTWSNGRLADDNANKAVCVECKDAFFSMAYTGLAQIGPKKTDDWIVDCLISMKAPELPLKSLVEQFSGRISRDLKGLNVAPRHLSFVLAGFCNKTPFEIFVSNFEDLRSSDIQSPKDDFTCSYAKPKPGLEHKCSLISVNGLEKAIDDRLRGILKSIRKCSLLRRIKNHSNAHSISLILVDIIRQASESQEFGRYIGKDCMSVILDSSWNIQTEYHPKESGPVSYAPHLVRSIFSMKGIEFTGEPIEIPLSGPPNT